MDLQQGIVEAVTGDDTVLAGLAVQDPATVVIGDAVTSEPYGLGIADNHVYLVKFVNRVIANMIKDGSWAASYQKWLVPSLQRRAGATEARHVPTGADQLMGNGVRIPSATEINQLIAEWNDWLAARTDALLSLEERVRTAGNDDDVADVAAVFVA